MTPMKRSGGVLRRYARRPEAASLRQLGEHDRVPDRVAAGVIVEVGENVRAARPGVRDECNPPAQDVALVARGVHSVAFVEAHETPIRRPPHGLLASRCVGETERRATTLEE